MYFDQCPGKILDVIRTNCALSIKPILIMMVGLQGSGKSTLANEIKAYIEIVTETKVYIHSSDKLRKEMFGKEDTQDKNAILFQELHNRIKNDLINNRIVIYDATNINKRKRAAFLHELQNNKQIINLCTICLCIATSLEDCINSLATRKDGVNVPYKVLEKYYKSWQPPHWSEGWDNILYVYRKKYFNYISDLILESINYNQNNKHHSYDLSVHHNKTKEYIKLFYNKTNRYLEYAANIHDLGKMFCEFKDNSGESHFYGHESVSSYLSMLDMDSQSVDDTVYVTNLIYLHMLPYNKNIDRKINEIKNKYGDEFYNDLIILHEADIASH